MTRNTPVRAEFHVAGTKLIPLDDPDDDPTPAVRLAACVDDDERVYVLDPEQAEGLAAGLQNAATKARDDLGIPQPEPRIVVHRTVDVDLLDEAIVKVRALIVALLQPERLVSETAPALAAIKSSERDLGVQVLGELASMAVIVGAALGRPIEDDQLAEHRERAVRHLDALLSGVRDAFAPPA